MASNELRNKTELTSVTGDEWVYAQDNLPPFTVKKVQIDTIAAYAGAGEIVDDSDTDGSDSSGDAGSDNSSGKLDELIENL